MRQPPTPRCPPIAVERVDPDPDALGCARRFLTALDGSTVLCCRGKYSPIVSTVQ